MNVHRNTIVDDVVADHHLGGYIIVLVAPGHAAAHGGGVTVRVFQGFGERLADLLDARPVLFQQELQILSIDIVVI